MEGGPGWEGAAEWETSNILLNTVDSLYLYTQAKYTRIVLKVHKNKIGGVGVRSVWASAVPEISSAHLLMESLWKF